MFKNPVMMFFGAAAQFGIFATIILAVALGQVLHFISDFQYLKVASANVSGQLGSVIAGGPA
jgi:Na+-transporting methylmalonyl-CoA/oxaloacetate decarboxylase beta subunit